MTKFLNNITITKKILFISLFPFIILCLISFFIIFSNIRQNKNLIEFINTDIKKTKDLKRIKELLILTSYQLNVILIYSIDNTLSFVKASYSEVQKALLEIPENLSLIDKMLNEFLNSKIYSEKEKEEIKKIKDEYYKFKENILNIINKKDKIDFKYASSNILDIYKNYDNISIKTISILTKMEINSEKVFERYISSNKNTFLLIIFSSLVIIITILLLITIIYKNIKTRINIFSSNIHSLVEGNLNREIISMGKDEIGIMLSLLEELRKKFSTTLSIIKDSSTKNVNDIIKTGEKIDSEKVMIETIIEEIKKINSIIIDQSAIVSEVSSTIEEITRTIENQDLKINSQSASVSQSSSSIQQMIANIQSITNNLNINSGEFKKLEEIVITGGNNFKELSENIQELHKMSESVLEANNIIKNIASQTNLLAMNASIEAAHAGEYGKGFAVVAEEIRKLAELSSSQTKSISENMKNLRNFINKTLNISVVLGNSFENIIKSVTNVSNLETEIRHSIEEQASGSSQILSALQNIIHITDEVNTGSKEMLHGSEAILKEIMRLVNITENVRESSGKIIEKINEINEMITSSYMLIKENLRDSKDVSENLSFFKV